MHWGIEAIKLIKSVRVAHRNWRSVVSLAYAFMNASIEGEVVCITGPSRVGKSRLIKALCAMVTGSYKYVDEECMPVVCVRVSNESKDGSFTTKDFVERALEALKHPIYGVVQNDIESEVKRLNLLKYTSERVLTKALENIIAIRKTRYFFVDEPQHIRYVLRSDKNAAKILESWKCLAENAGTTLVLVGAYPLLEVFKLCPHMLGRKHQVHFQRYQYTESDLLAFSEILEVYSKYVVLPKGVDSLNEWIDELYEGSMGCIGHLEGWLRRSIALVLANDDDALTLKHLKATRKPKSEEASLSEEMMEGEKILGKTDFFANDDAVRKQENPEKVEKKTRKPKKRNPRPFRKNPRRYSIGGRDGGCVA